MRMYVINKGQINCVRDAGHDIPNFLIDSGELRLDKVTLYKEFRVICDNLDVSSYTLKSPALVEPSPIMDFTEEMERNYGRPLMSFVPSKYLDILKQTESLFVLDFRYGMAIGLRRLLEDFVIENYGVLIFEPTLFRKSPFPSSKKLSLKKKRTSWILEALLKKRVFSSNEYKMKVESALSRDQRFSSALLSDSDLKGLFDIYNSVSDYIHGKSSEPSSIEFRDWLELLLRCCLEYCNRNIGWGMP